ncbi:WS/DGAT domain-containing protein [Pseudarthrobacter sp. RMG13]|uniref:diacylglycerol O-acyltransferase n=1 Tax=Pseudarthrobacter humi TaxID=2952523 RepID=A0ABT1LNG1_9MICC|nr:wax ester/triacylglycerol synthase domain-containing protein [Pseudarthrobacter humi]MCP8999414.1 WS/DGAT domain-containing protein [Pseudarthrobacter humi]
MRPETHRLAAVDEANLVLDHAGQVNVFLVACVLESGGFVGPDGAPDLVVFRDTLRERIVTLPQLRRRAVARGPLHHWVEVQPDLDHHIRLVKTVDGVAGFEQACAELMSAPLGMDRPLWEILVMPGAHVGGMGVVLRIHHAVADGISAAAIVQKLFDPVDSQGVSAQAHPVRVPKQTRRRDLRHALGRLGFALRRVRLTLAGREVGPTVLLGERSSRRAVVFMDADLDALESHVRPAGATVNDALLAAVASGYRALLSAAGEQIPARLPVSVPVALQRRGASGNQVGVMLVRLPLGEADTDEHVRLIAEQTRKEKARAREQGTLEFMRGPIGAHIMDRVARRQHLVAGFVTNVQGPVGTFRLAGAPVVAIWPVAVLAANVRLGVAAVSYAGRLHCSVHFDAENVPGAIFARAMGLELARLGV